MDGVDVMRFLGADVLSAIVLGATIRYALAGGLTGGDDDKARMAFWRELITAPLQGVPIVRDIADLTVGEIMGDRRFNSSLQVPVLGFIDNTVRQLYRIPGDIRDGEWDSAACRAADVVGDWTQLPAVRIIKRAKRLTEDIFNGGEEL